MKDGMGMLIVFYFQDSQNFEAAIGEVLALSKEDGIMRLNQLIVKYSNHAPPLIEKMKLVLLDKDWDQATDIASRILVIESNNIPALQVNQVKKVSACVEICSKIYFLFRLIF